jgi:hypothetical protein
MIWKVVSGFPDYEISHAGVVRRLTSKKRARAGAVKEQWQSTSGRMNVGLYRDGRGHKFQVHRLVLEAFVGPCPEGMECRHLDGNHLNNDLTNLEWSDHTVNMRDRVAHGTSLHGERNPLARITHWHAKAIRILRERHSQPRSGVNAFLSRFMGISISIVSKVGRGSTWNET